MSGERIRPSRVLLDKAEREEQDPDVLALVMAAVAGASIGLLIVAITMGVSLLLTGRV